MTTLTLCGSSGAEKILAFTQMACARPRLRPVSGLRFSPFDPALTAGRIAILIRAENWYREKLFPCFVPVAAEGT